MRILGVDPGAVHVGVSEWESKRCVISYELTPIQFAQRVNDPRWLEQFEVVCAEAYVPQGGFGDGATGVDTIKLLGLLEWLVRLRSHGERTVILTTRLDRSAALRRLKAVKYPFHDHEAPSGHARDSEAVVVSAMRWGAKEVA